MIPPELVLLEERVANLSNVDASYVLRKVRLAAERLDEYRHWEANLHAHFLTELQHAQETLDRRWPQ